MKIVVISLILIVETVLSALTMNAFLHSDTLPSNLEEGNTLIVESPSQGLIKIETMKFDSVTWQNTQWQNHLMIIRPPIVLSTVAVIFITGDYKYTQEELSIFRLLALQNKAYVAVLFDIPNQPLFGGLREDWLLSYSFSQFIETGDYSWPALLPMVKSTVVSMNLLDDYIKNMGDKIEGFILTGGSKRGWTTWLTAAMDKRVKGIVPIAFDNLNIAEQMQHQLSFWGSFSPSIREYVERGILDDLDNPVKRDLLQYIDPFTYRMDLEVPKLIVVGTNDPYWPIDASKLYVDNLPGYFSMVYAPNAGHGTEIFRVTQAISSMIYHINTGEELPALSCKTVSFEEGARIHPVVKTGDAKLNELRLFTASSPDGDFRKSSFEFEIINENQSIELSFGLPTAYYIEGVFIFGGKELLISTPAVVFGK